MSNLNAMVGDRVKIDGQAGTVTKVHEVDGTYCRFRIVSATSDRVESDGEASLLIDVIELD